MNRNLTSKIILIIVLIAVGGWTLYPPSSKLKPGRDLAGGTSLIYEIDTYGLKQADRKDLAARMITVLRRRIDPANIQMVNLKSDYHPFTIVKEGNVEIKPYYMPMDDHRNIDSTMFITWPRRGTFKNGDYTSALSHVIKWGWHEKTEKTLTQIYLIGMIDDPTEQKRVDRLVNLAKNWQYAPELVT